MQFSKINFFCACVVGLALIAPVYNAPRKHSKGHSSSTKYDQHQTGDYNIQVRLKDFRIIGIFGDDPFGGDGDYDINYDYSDLTVKPTFPLPTASPSDSTINNSSEAAEDLHKPEKPNDYPYPIVSPSTTVENGEKSTTLQSQSTTAPLSVSAISVRIVTSEPQVDVTKSEKVSSGTEKPTSQESNNQVTENPQKLSTAQNGQSPQKSTKLENSQGVPGEGYEKKTEPSVTNVSIVSSESNASVTQSDHHVPLGEIMHYRKCADGYGKDKLGRCRKIIRRTPQLPFGISRLASSLASRFRQATAGTRSAPEND